MKIGIILMASGFSNRFGGNKLLTLLDGKPMYSYILNCLENVIEKFKNTAEIHVAVVSQYDEILKAAEGHKLTAVYNPRSSDGITASIKLGLENLPCDTEHYGFFVADQPYLRYETVIDFLNQYLDSGKGIGCMSCGEKLGNPVMFSRKYYRELYELEGDKGGKQVVFRHVSDIFKYFADESELTDIDKREDFREIKKEQKNENII